MGFFYQTWTLIVKNILIVLTRHAITTPLRACALPVALTLFLSFAKNIYIPPSFYGVGQSHPILSLKDAFDAAGGGRNTIVFVDSGFKNGPISQVISSLTSSIGTTTKTVITTSDESLLLETCRSSVRGASACYGAVVFYSSPSEGKGGIWNYTLKFDWALGSEIYVNRNDNDAEIYAIPFQHAVDSTIAKFNTNIDRFVANKLMGVQEYTYTTLTQAERQTQIREKYMGTIINILAVAFLVAFIGISYHLTGFQAAERQLEMSTLIEAMLPNKRRWEPQVARLLSYHLAFAIIYSPGWIATSIVLSLTLFTQTSPLIIILFCVLAGLALGSFSILGAAFFKRDQLSGVIVAIFALLLGIVVQVTEVTSSITVAILSLLFTPCAFVYFMIFTARYEHQDLGVDLFNTAPQSPWDLPGIFILGSMAIQIFVYPVLGALVEKRLYGTASHGRIVQKMDKNSLQPPVQLRSFSKEYHPSWLYDQFVPQNEKTVEAVKTLSLEAGRGEILVLLGANGSGKSTTLDCIAGLNTVTSGSIIVDGRGGIGIAPQKNVLWDDLTVHEHIKIFNKLKSTGRRASDAENRALISAVDLGHKINTKASNLSGGQKRKLQLGMMFTGGSSVCCIDEVSSGLDPISRRKIWDILLTERGRRTMIMTTHFLDEAEMLADEIAILSKGTLRAAGSAVELKSNLGGGFRVHLPVGQMRSPDLEGFEKHIAFDHVVYYATNSAKVARLVDMLEDRGIIDYNLEGPSIEDVFLRLAEEIRLESESEVDSPGKDPNSLLYEIPEKDFSEKHPFEKHTNGAIIDNTGESQVLQLISGIPISFPRETWILFRKRCTILRRNLLPYVAAFLFPVVASALVTLFLRKEQVLPGCAPGDSVRLAFTENLFDQISYQGVVGPSNRFGPAFFQSLLPPSTPANVRDIFQQNTTKVDTLPEFNNYISHHFANVTPGAIFLGSDSSPPTFAWKGNNYDIYSAIFAQNILNNLLTNISISAQYSNFDIPLTPESGNSLQLVVYFGLAMAAYPAFFALYPTVERIRGVRGLEYSNGVRSLPLWLAYICFDWIFVLASSLVVFIIFAAQSDVWYNVGYLFIVFILYGMTSILMSYIISLFAKTQLAAFGFVAAGQTISLVIYVVGYLLTLTFVPITKVDSILLLLHYTLSLIFPIGSLARSMFIGLNLFSITCTGNKLAPNPLGLNQYGSPILYLSTQILVLFSILLCCDSNSISSLTTRFRSNRSHVSTSTEHLDVPSPTSDDPEPHSGLQVSHLTKSFKSNKNTVVDNISFYIPPNEVFALLGPNGAGKSTTISLIRGDIPPSPSSGPIHISSTPLFLQRSAARRHLGVCPQHDAIDAMTVNEHLQFYARIRGIPDTNHNIRQLLSAVGLEAFRERLAMQLSGGNKRKLSLAIALMGNPSVLLLDEPSSGMDAAAKRVMWKTLKAVSSGRSILLTTHSMEEADALASRVGIMKSRMLAMGDINSLRREYGERFFVHVICKSAPGTTEREMEDLKEWVHLMFGRDAVVEEKTYHGQLRFSVPVVDPNSPAGSDSFERLKREKSEILGRGVVYGYGAGIGESSGMDDRKDGGDLMWDSRSTLRFIPDYQRNTLDIVREGRNMRSVDEDEGVAGLSASASGCSGQPAIGHAQITRQGRGLVGLIRKIERDKEVMGIEGYSVARTGLDQLFLGIVGGSEGR